MSDKAIDLVAIDDDFGLETMPEGTSLGSFSSATTASSASCPATSASSFTTASSLG